MVCIQAFLCRVFWVHIVGFLPGQTAASVNHKARSELIPPEIFKKTPGPTELVFPFGKLNKASQVVVGTAEGTGDHPESGWGVLLGTCQLLVALGNEPAPRRAWRELWNPRSEVTRKTFPATVWPTAENDNR